MNGSIPIRTRRLLLRPFGTMDFMDVYDNYASDPEVSKYMTWSAHENPMESMEYLSSFVDKYDERDFYHWAIELPGRGVIGSISVTESDRLGHEWAELGYCLSREYWNQGMMGEVLLEVLRYLREEGYLYFKARCHVDNIASRKVLEKSGFHLLREGVCDGTPVYFFSTEGEGGTKDDLPTRETEAFSISLGENKEEEKTEDPYSAFTINWKDD